MTLKQLALICALFVQNSMVAMLVTTPEVAERIERERKSGFRLWDLQSLGTPVQVVAQLPDSVDWRIVDVDGRTMAMGELRDDA